jgi:hypothetical protein
LSILPVEQWDLKKSHRDLQKSHLEQ